MAGTHPPLPGILAAVTLTYSIADQNFHQTKSIGILNLSAQLLEALAEHCSFSRFSVLSNSSLKSQLSVPPHVQVSLHDGAIGGRLGRMWWDQVKVYLVARRTGNEWLFLPKGFASFVMTPKSKLAVYVHDAVHDFYRKEHPKAVPALEAAYFEKSFRAVLRHADVIVTNSDFTAREVHRLAEAQGLRCPLTRTVGIGFNRVKNEAKPKENRILVLAGRWPHKRTDLAVKFLEEWQKKTSWKGSVEWVGSFPEGCGLPAFSNWKRHSRLAEETFRQLVTTSNALVYFSDYEGFGMPPVEAVIAGACPVYSDIPATREVMDGAGGAFDNQSFASFSAAMASALQTPASQLEAWAERLLARHDWKTVATRTFAALKEAR